LAGTAEGQNAEFANDFYARAREGRNGKTDLHGWPSGDVASLNPNHQPSPNGRVRGADGPRLVGFKGPDRREESLGAWYCLDNGARGDSLFALVQYLSGCDFATATRFLKDLADRLCEVKS
jgi:hypothetical protein